MISSNFSSPLFKVVGTVSLPNFREKLRFTVRLFSARTLQGPAGLVVQYDHPGPVAASLLFTHTNKEAAHNIYVESDFDYSRELIDKNIDCHIFEIYPTGNRYLLFNN